MTQLNTSTTTHYQQLSAEERGQIQSWHEDHYSIRLGRLPLDSIAILAQFAASLSGERFDSNYLPYYRYFADAGPEIAVASTKAYTAQIAVEAILAKALGEADHQIVAERFDIRQELAYVATGMQAIVDSKEKIEELAKTSFMKTRNAFYIGRGLDWTVSLEASLKLKEISYVQAEGFASGELKHGTIALIESGTPVIGIITQKKTAGLTRSNLQETLARGAKVVTIVSTELAKPSDDLVLPAVNELLTPLLSVVPTQLLAYYTSLNKGLDVDKPRNLAKSVTVE